MKWTSLRCLYAISHLAAASALTSCIYDTPAGDEFFRTLWASDEAPFDDLTIEFLCDGNITAQAANAAGSFGTYECHDLTATFTGLHLILEQGTVIIEEAHRHRDQLTIRWHYEGDQTGYSTLLRRLSAYE